MPKPLGSHWKKKNSEHELRNLRNSSRDRDELLDMLDRPRIDSRSLPPMEYSPIVMSRRHSRAETFFSPGSHGVWLKILLLGDSGTGKTSITQRFLHRKFDPDCCPTLDVDMNSVGVDVGQIRIHLQLFNLVEFARGTQIIYDNHFQGVHGAFIVGDISQMNTVDHLLQWKARIDATLEETRSEPISVIFLANKIDKIDEEGVLFSKSKVDKACKMLEVRRWFATSAKTETNINLAIKQMVLDILKGPYSGNFQAITSKNIAEFEAHVASLKVTDITQSLAKYDPCPPETEMPSFWKPNTTRRKMNLPSHEYFEDGESKIAATGCACAVS